MKKLIIYLYLIVIPFPVSSLVAQEICTTYEPNVELAKLWWPEQRNVWTPIGWKDHYFRFNVLYNGMLIVEPAPGFTPRLHSRRWVDQDFLLTFRASTDGQPKPLPADRLSLWKIDGGHGIQGWTKGHETPVLWTEYRSQEGVVLKSEVFAHITSNDDIVTALEPLYAWVRLSVCHVDRLRYPETISMSVQLTKCHVDHGEHYEYAVAVDAMARSAVYPRKLTSEPYVENGLTGYRILEPDDKVRMVVLPTESGRVKFEEMSEGIYNLQIIFKAEEGNYVDMLVPMLPEPRDIIEKEEQLTYDGALTMSDWYWGKKPETAAEFHVPEQFINEALKQSLKFAPIIAEMDYKTREYSYHSGSWGYDLLWTTPTSMVSHMFIDQMGYFDMTKKYSDVFYKNQGTVKPPGDAYQMHAGYFSTHKLLTSIDWLTDHGAVMHQLATHALLSGDKEFIERWTPPLVKACEFLMEASAITGHGGVEGLLPPAVASDEIIPMQAVWNIAWNYKGLLTTIRLLKKTDHPRVGEFIRFAADFKEIFLREYRKVVEDGPKWVDSQGLERYKPSTVMSNIQPPYHIYNDAFYLDTGPMVLVWAELMEPDDPIMVDIIDFFREGPNHRLWETMYHAIDRAILIHEMSSCEPCYSWNVFYSWKLADRQRFLEGMYSIMVGAISQNTYISCEHRDGIQGNLFSFPLAFYLAKLSVIDDQISEGDLHLLRLCPLAWISSEEDTYFENMPTEFGPVNLRFRLSKDRKSLNITFSAKWRESPSNLIIHVPHLPGLERVIINGESYSDLEEINFNI